MGQLARAYAAGAKAAGSPGGKGQGGASGKGSAPGGAGKWPCRNPPCMAACKRAGLAMNGCLNALNAKECSLCQAPRGCTAVYLDIERQKAFGRAKELLAQAPAQVVPSKRAQKRAAAAAKKAASAAATDATTKPAHAAEAAPPWSCR